MNNPYYPDRKTHLRYLLLEIPEGITHRPATISDLAKSLNISRITASNLFNLKQSQCPISLRMAVRLYLATRNYLGVVGREKLGGEEVPSGLKDPDGTSSPPWLHPTTPEEWLELDEIYKIPSRSQQIEQLIEQLEREIQPLARVKESKTH